MGKAVECSVSITRHAVGREPDGRAGGVEGADKARDAGLEGDCGREAGADGSGGFGFLSGWFRYYWPGWRGGLDTLPVFVPEMQMHG